MSNETTASDVIEQAVLDRIVYIGDELPESLVHDTRPKFVLLGTPAEFIAAATGASS